jgi:hypothetical protein
MERNNISYIYVDNGLRQNEEFHYNDAMVTALFPLVFTGNDIHNEVRIYDAKARR